MEVNIHNAKTNLSRLIEQAENGEEVIIARAGKPVVRLVPVPSGGKRSLLGSLEGKFLVREDFHLPDPKMVDLFYREEKLPRAGKRSR